MSDDAVERIEAEILTALRGYCVVDIPDIIVAQLGCMAFHLSMLNPKARDRTIDAISRSLEAMEIEAAQIAATRPSISKH